MSRSIRKYGCKFELGDTLGIIPVEFDDGTVGLCFDARRGGKHADVVLDATQLIDLQAVIAAVVMGVPVPSEET